MFLSKAKLLVPILSLIPIIAPSAWAETPSEKRERTLEDFVSPQKGSWLHDQWEKLKIQVDGKILDADTDFGSSGALGTNLSFRYQVQPAFVKNYHQRFDMYKASLGLGYGDSIGVSTNLEAQVTFSRLYPTKNEAIKARVYFLNRFPFKGEEALTHLTPGDAVRLEISSDGSIGKGFSELFSEKGNATAYLSLSKGTRFILDVYRMKNNRTRMRLLANRNLGSINGGIGLNPLGKFDIGVSILDRVLNRWFHCSPAALNASNTLGEDNPIDTIMVDYIFDLKQQEGLEAYNEVMKEVKHLQWALLLNYLRSPKGLSDALVNYVAKAEQQFQRDRSKSYQDRAVDRLFKGRTMTESSSVTLKSDCFRIWDSSITTSHTVTSVQSFDRNDQTSDNILVATNLKKKGDYFLNFLGTESDLSVNALFPGQRVNENQSTRVIPTGLSDLVIARTFKDKALRHSELVHMIHDFNYQYPAFSKSVDWISLMTGEKQINAYARMSFVFHRDALENLRGMSGSELYSKLREFVDNHPRKLWLPHDLSNNRNTDGHQMSDKFEEDVQYISIKLAEILNATDVMTSFDGFAELRRNNLFQAIGAGFLMSLLPDEEVRNKIHLDFTAGSDQRPAVSVSTSAPGASNLYTALNFILNTLNDRSFDLRLQLDANGEIMPTRFSPTADQHCEKCL